MHKLETFNFFLHNIVNRLGMLIKTVNSVKIWLNCSKFQSILNTLPFSSFWRTNHWNIDSIFCRNYLVHNLGEGRMYPAALHRISTQTVDLSQVFERWNLQKQPKMINKMSKSGDRNTISGLEQVCPKQAQDFFSWLLSSKSILRRLILSSWSVIWVVGSISQKECYRKNHVDLKELN